MFLSAQRAAAAVASEMLASLASAAPGGLQSVAAQRYAQVSAL